MIEGIIGFIIGIFAALLTLRGIEGPEWGTPTYWRWVMDDQARATKFHRARAAYIQHLIEAHDNHHDETCALCGVLWYEQQTQGGDILKEET